MGLITLDNPGEYSIAINVSKASFLYAVIKKPNGTEVSLTKKFTDKDFYYYLDSFNFSQPGRYQVFVRASNVPKNPTLNNLSATFPMDVKVGNSRLTESEIIEAKKNLEKLMQGHLVNGSVLKKINLRNSNGEFDGSWGDGSFMASLMEYVDKRKLTNAYMAFQPGDKYRVLFNWLKVEAEGKSINDYPVPVEWYKNWKIWPRTTDGIERYNYFAKYIKPILMTINPFTNENLLYEVWLDETYGLEGIEKIWEEINNYLVIQSGVFGGIVGGFAKVIAGTATVLIHPVRTAEGVWFLWKAMHPRDYPEEAAVFQMMLNNALDGWVDDFQNGSDYNRAEMVGEIIGEIFMALISAKGVDKIVKLVKTLGESSYVSGIFRKMSTGAMTVDEAVVAMETAANAIENATGDIARFASGARRSALNILTEEEMAFIKNEFAAIGGDPNKLVFNAGGGTCYVDELDQIFVRGDIFPIEDAAHPRSNMSPRAVLAHEYYGHAANTGTPVPPGMWNDEFRASYMAAKNAPNLTDLDRYNLIQDAITRAQEAGVTIELNDFMRSILYGY